MASTFRATAEHISIFSFKPHPESKYRVGPLSSGMSNGPLTPSNSGGGSRAFSHPQPAETMSMESTEIIPKT